MYELIKDNNQYEKFIEIMPELKDDEVYFISLSARNKYLTAEEREFYALGRTEMFGRTVVKRKEDFYFAMNKLEAMLTYKHTKNGKSIPKKALVVYVNVNPSSMIKAYEMYVNEMNRELFQVTQALRHDKVVNYEGFINMERKMMNCIQKCRERRYFIDIDIDTKNETILNRISFRLKSVDYKIIETQGGWHILIKKDSLTKEVKLHEVVKEMNDAVKDEGGEVMFNKNQMIPVPGTLQAGKLVTIY